MSSNVVVYVVSGLAYVTLSPMERYPETTEQCLSVLLSPIPLCRRLEVHVETVQSRVRIEIRLDLWEQTHGGMGEPERYDAADGAW